MQNILHFITLSIVASVAFSITHARDVSAVSNFRIVKTAAKSASVDLGISHHDPHTHIHRQTLTSLLKNMQKDRPQASERSLKKLHKTAEKRAEKRTDGALGYCLPQSSL